MTPRTYLYVPGHRPEMLAKATTRGADALVIDFEDAVPMDQKESARSNFVSWLDQLESARCEIWVRVNNHPDLLIDDLSAVGGCPITGISLPKASEPDQIRSIRQSLTNQMGVIALIETAAGVFNAPAIAAESGVVRLAIGEADLCADLQIDAESPALTVPRTQIVLASAAAGLPAPIGPVATRVPDVELLEASTRALRSLGFGARSAIHPAHIKPINSAFSYSPTEITEARELLRRAQDQAERGEGAFLDVDGRMIDEAILRRARQIADHSPETD